MSRFHSSTQLRSCATVQASRALQASALCSLACAKASMMVGQPLGHVKPSTVDTPRLCVRGGTPSTSLTIGTHAALPARR